MKILYAIQGTGNGHLARAVEIVPQLKCIADTDVLVSGIQGDIQLPFKVDYRFYGLSFINGKKGGINVLKTILKLNVFRFVANVFKLQVEDYDLVISDFEPVSAWACKLIGKNCIGLSHQNAVLHSKAPRPASIDWFGQLVLKYYAPTKWNYGFHFKALDENNFAPIIRNGIREAKPINFGHYTVYLPAYSDAEILQLLSKYDHIHWEVFSKQCKQPYTKGRIHFYPISLRQFTLSFVNCEGILTTAGFETPSEAMFMGKKLCVVPTKNQYEQQCNAAFLNEMGITVITSFKDEKSKLTEWVYGNSVVKQDYPNYTKNILQNVIAKHIAEEEYNPYYWIFPQKFMRPIQLKIIALKGNRLIPFNTLERRGAKISNLFRQFFEL